MEQATAAAMQQAAAGGALLARRALLGAGHAAAAHASDGDAAAGAGGDAHSLDAARGHAAAGTLDVRVIAIFAIAASALMCGLPPLFMRAFQSPDAPVARVSRAFAGGIVLSLALVHIIPDAVTELGEIVDFPVGGVAVLFGIIALVIIDSSLTALWAPKDYKEQLRAAATAPGGAAAGAQGAGHGAGAPAATPTVIRPLKGGCGHHHKPAPAADAEGGDRDAPSGAGRHGHDADGHGHGHAHAHAHAHDHSAHGNKDAAAVAVAAGAAHGHSHLSPAAAALAAAEEGAGGHVPHTHSCTSSLTAQRWLGSAAAKAAGPPMAGVKQLVTAYTMELGCIFHSIIIGVGVGVVTADRQLVIVLMIALIVHQGLEGMSLGTVLALTPFQTAKKVIMVLLYSFTTSLGIAIGIAVSASYDAGSVTSKAVQGTLNGVSGGMLLYISMYQLIAEEFSREDLVVKPRLRGAMIGGLLMGAACMCVLAIWS